MKRIYFFLLLFLLVFVSCKNPSKSGIDSIQKDVENSNNQNKDSEIKNPILIGEIEAASSLSSAFGDNIWLITFPSGKTCFVKVIGSKNDNALTFSFINLNANVKIRLSEFWVIKSAEYSGNTSIKEIEEVFASGAIFNLENEVKTLRNEENDKMVSFSKFDASMLSFITEPSWKKENIISPFKFLYDENENLLSVSFDNPLVFTEEESIFLEGSYYVENIKENSEVYLVSKDFSVYYFLSIQTDSLIVFSNNGSIKPLMQFYKEN